MSRLTKGQAGQSEQAEARSEGPRKPRKGASVDWQGRVETGCLRGAVKIKKWTIVKHQFTKVSFILKFG